MTHSDRLAGWPTFVRELEGTLAVHAQYVLHGNIRDLYLVPGDEDGTAARLEPITSVLWEALRRSGYRCLIGFDTVDGLSLHSPDTAEAAGQVLGAGVLGTQPSLEKLRAHLSTVVSPAAELEPITLPDGREAPPPRPRAAMLIDYASRIPRVPGSLDQTERDFFLFCQKLANTARPLPALEGPRPYALFNPIIWLSDGERDLPQWLAAGTERIRTIGLSLPGLDERHSAARLLARRFGVRNPAAGSPDARLIDRFALETDGMTLHAMREATRLAYDRQMGFDRLPDAVRVYKLGIADNPWEGVRLRERIRAGAAPDPDGPGPSLHKGTSLSLHRRVKGQTAAVNKTLDILMRAALGLSGSQATSSGSRPRGVLFFAGPTGVGKTELAKSVAHLLFGDTESYLRFDMSEFSASHAADRLVGAPPGYVGFEAGGELTSAVRRRPFRVVLFDEIEKAHSAVLDKFLQILEDGRLTDGQGVTTYFSECVLVFTSNLGIVETDQRTNEKTVRVSTEMGLSYEQLRAVILAGIEREFKVVMGRPELLNRFGDNIVIFDFISAPTAGKIFDSQLANILRRVGEEQQITVEVPTDIRDELRKHCTQNLDNGGRGIGNALESAFINPLARGLFSRGLAAGSTVRITGIDLTGEQVALTLADLTTVEGD